jgi:beta-N-acetylhexosaminidase
MYLRFRIIAAELKALGIDVNCAPVADIARPDTHPFLRNRCYGDTAAEVVGLARAAADGLLDGGVVPVVKHMPGHGLGAVDSHHTLPQVTATAAALEQDDFAAFKGLNDLPMAMTAHVVYSACDSLPATVSGRMLGIMRHQIGFSGLIMTDDISMQALPGELDVRAQAAIAAGCDVVLHCSGVLEEMIAVSHVVGRMGMAARQRAEGALAQRNSGGSVDISNLDAQLAILVGKQAYD